MKKILTLFFVLVVVGLNAIVIANEPEFNEDPAKVECNTDKGDGTTTFVYCTGCESITAKPLGSLDRCRH